MVFNNSVNSSNTDLELSTGTLQFANRTRLLGGIAENIGIAYNSGTGVFSVQGGDGNALSSTNPGYINIQSKVTPGKQLKIAVTANQTFIDDVGSSEIIGNLFGLVTGVAATNTIPFFIYAVINDSDNAIAFMISRFPNTRISPVSAKIGKSGSAVADSQGSFFSLANITVTDYDSNPCVSIGSFRMTMSASDDWTVTTLDFQDGIGCFQEDRQFTWGTGLWGNASGKYYADNGGTAPSFSTNNIGYWIDRNNQMQFSTQFTNATAGVGAVNLQLCVPYTMEGVAVGSCFVLNATSLIFSGCCFLVSGATQKIQIYVVNDASSVLLLNNQVTTSANYNISHFVRSRIQFV